MTLAQEIIGARPEAMDPRDRYFLQSIVRRLPDNTPNGEFFVAERELSVRWPNNVGLEARWSWGDEPLVLRGIANETQTDLRTEIDLSEFVREHLLGVPRQVILLERIARAASCGLNGVEERTRTVLALADELRPFRVL